ncbi:MAG: hypothetical protein ABIH23_05080 [bacterium]
MGFEDVFAGIQFDDAKISLTGDTAQDAGNTGIPAPVDDKGQATDSPSVTDAQSADTKDSDDNKGKEPDKKAAEEKAAPYDQDPKWKKARAAEAALNTLMKELGVLDVEELKELAKNGLDLGKALDGKDPKKLLEDADYLGKVKKSWDTEETAKKYANETPEERATRLESELAKTRKEHEDFKNNVQDRERAKQVIDNFGKEVHRVIAAEDEPFDDSEQALLKMFLGVDNPANMIDIEDKVAVRKMASEGIGNFRTFVKAIQDKAIEQYVKGKRDLSVDTSKPSSSTVKTKPAETKTATNAPKGGASIDEVFDAANREFLEVLAQGVRATT